MKNRSIKNLSNDQILNIYNDKFLMDCSLAEMSKKYNTTEKVLHYILNRPKFTPKEFIGKSYIKKYPGNRKNHTETAPHNISSSREIVAINYKLRRRIHARTRCAFKKIGVSLNTIELDSIIGDDLDKIRVWIEKQFRAGMSWSNFKIWQLDHRTPVSMANNSDELRVLCHYTNLQPLMPIDNCIKGAG